MKKVPQRMCVACKTRKDKSELLRVVLMPDGRTEIDPSGKMPGRGAYVCKDDKCIAQALKANQLQRGLKTQVDADTMDRLKTIEITEEQR